jgi:hypothetical protein
MKAVPGHDPSSPSRPSAATSPGPSAAVSLASPTLRAFEAPLSRTSLVALQATAGNAAVNWLLRERGLVSLQREPQGSTSTSDKPGASSELGTEGHEEYPPWSRSTPMDALPGDPVPPEARGDALKISTEILRREEANKRNWALFTGAYGKALMELWGKELTEQMKKAGEHAGWSLFQSILKFAAIKALEWSAAAMFTPAAAEVFEALGAKFGEAVTEKAVEAGVGFYLDKRAEGMEEHRKESQLGKKKEDLDAVTDRFAALLGDLPTATAKLMPSVSPWHEWLRNAQPYQLDKFRLPPLFPKPDPTTIRGVVAGVIVGEMHGVLRAERHGSWGLQTGTPDPRDPSVVEPGDDDIIVVERMERAVIHATSEELAKAIAGKVPIAQLPLVPLFISQPRDLMADEDAATVLMRAFRGTSSGFERTVGTLEPDREVREFLKAYQSEEGRLEITRNSEGEVKVSGTSLAGNLKLYRAGSGDRNLATLSKEVLDWAHGQAEYEQPDEGVSRMADAADLAKKTHYFLQEQGKSLEWAKTMIASDISKLVPTARD